MFKKLAMVSGFAAGAFLLIFLTFVSSTTLSSSLLNLRKCIVCIICAIFFACLASMQENIERHEKQITSLEKEIYELRKIKEGVQEIENKDGE